MSGANIALIVLLLLAALFALGVTRGGRSADSTAPNLSWVETIGSVLTPSLDFSKLQGPCLDPKAKLFLLNPGSPCLVFIHSSSRGTRKLTLGLAGGIEVDARYAAPPGHEKIDPNDDSGDQSIKIDGTKEVSLVILKEGGVLSLTCINSNQQTCTLNAR